MEHYKNISGNSGVTAYEIKDESVRVQFGHDSVYLYTYASAGKRNIEKMKKLAVEGAGLSTYISRHVKDKYI
ncbi:hypothetical protein R1T16_10065 [Flavobacterium sp. DG1-102-2]|uniref:hypothetical protein n=1 Tax=Flavobacterium sp. DG1-102-2 TaxID=3081663 RepID=UPI002948C69D|nr:hypothetical protein [Flavobacterium sp. DG1-102-2]MDV6168771.1 hypothetical protein [Flavobacterium sp. DG1-102-2]